VTVDLLLKHTSADIVTNQTAPQGNLSRFKNAEDIEFVYPDTENNWAEARCAVARIDPKRMQIVMQQPCHWNLYHRPWQLDEHEQCDAIAGNQVTGTINVTQGMALPPAAAAVVTRAGPRV
jgi:hypothetical protein